MACLSLAFAGCSGQAREAEAVSDASAEKSIVLGFSQLGSESAWRNGNSKSIQDAARRHGIQLMFKNAQQKQENQIKAIRSFIAYQVDVIAFAPIVETGWDNVLAEAKEAGIPVLLCDRYIDARDESLFAGFIGSDFVEEGRKAAQFMLERTKDMQGVVQIVELAGTLGSSPMKERASGFREVIRDNPKYDIVRSLSGDFLRSKGRENMNELIKDNVKFDVLFVHNDGMALGAIEALEKAGINPQDIIIISVDGEEAAIDALRQGKINCVVECTPLMGDRVMELAKLLAEGLPIPRNIYNEERVFTEFDDLSKIGPRGY